MADREDKSNLPPIPDGGLTDTMPDWLRRPPAWRALPDREVTVPAPDDDATLPEPDESVIDPRTFLDDDDLPAWLKHLGPGHTARPSVENEEAVPDEGSQAAPADRGKAGVAQPVDQRPKVTPSRFRPTTPPATRTVPDSSDADRDAVPQLPSRPDPASPPLWQGAWTVTILAVLLVVAIAVIIVLVL